MFYNGKLQLKRALTGLALVLCVAMSLTACRADGEQDAQEQAEIDPKAYDHILSPEAFEKMKEGMTPEEVLEIAEVEPYKTTTAENLHSEIIYMWYADPVPNRYTVSFLDNKFESKDYIDVIKLQEEGRKKK